MVILELDRTIAVGQSTLWRYLSTAEGLSVWHADEVQGSLKGREFVARYPSLGAELRLKVNRLDEGRLIEFKAGQSQVTLRLESIDQDSTRILLSHAGLDESDDLDGFRSSWALALSLLEHAALAHPQKTRKARWYFERALVTPDLAHYYFSTQIGLRQWLGEIDGDLGSVGSPVQLRLSPELTLTGRVLCHEPGRDVCLSWSELGNATLTLRTLPAGSDERQLALCYSSFDARFTSAPHSELSHALTRLQSRLKARGKS